MSSRTGPTRQRGTRASWWLWSLGFHLLVFIGLWFSPARELIFERKRDARSEIKTDRRRIEEVAGQIDELQKQLMVRKLERLDDIRGEMEQIRELREEDFSRFAQELAQEAPATALELLGNAIREQGTVLEQFDPLEPAATRLPEFSGVAQRQRIDAMIRAETAALDEAERRRDSAQLELDHAREREQLARAAITDLRRKRDPKPPPAEVERANEALEAAKSETSQRQAELKQADAARREASSVLGKARRAAESAAEDEYRTVRQQVSSRMTEARDHQREARKLELDAARKIGFTDLPDAASVMEKAVTVQERADATLDRARAELEEVDRIRRELASALRKADELQARVEAQRQGMASATGERRDKLAAELAEREQQLTEARRQLDESKAAHAAATETARQSRAQARTAQSEARDAAREALGKLAEVVARRQQVAAAESRVAVDTSPPDLARVDTGRPVERILAAGGEMEEHIAETYRVVKAVDEAAMRQVPVAEALRKTQIALPDRPEPDLAALRQEPRTAADIESRKQAYREAQSQLSSSVSLAEQLLIQAKGEDNELGMSIDYEGMKVAAARHHAYEQLALEEGDARAKDMSALMRGEGEPSGTASARPAGAGGAGPAGSHPYPDLPQDPAARLPGGRRFTAQPGLAPLGNQWIAVDTWYCIGPFPNPNRREVDTRFPPDSVIDLDAAYRGMAGEMVRWQFVKSPKVPVSPPDEREYGIYYFYTELWFDEPMDAWIAVGSDDNSRIWIEDQMVWLSAYELKSWRIDEGFRKVHFREGVNRVLVRLENGWHGTGFSMLVSLGDGG